MSLAGSASLDVALPQQATNDQHTDDRLEAEECGENAVRMMRDGVVYFSTAPSR